ncbi:MAG: ATP-dependent zinc metalloprotease FtsH [Elusimicrobia bacterium]|nr:ATP-dependent zinc metalloprotease FtsH [Elusimicrobiota bacterium]
MKIRLSRVIASVLVAALVLGAPGSQAWGQVAASARAGSAAGIKGPVLSLTPAAGSFTAPALTLSAPSLAVPTLAPAPAALVAVTPVAAKPVAVKAAVPAELIPALDAARPAAPAAGDKNDGPMGRLASLFDGLKARRPAVDAVDAGSPSDAPRGPELGRPQPARSALASSKRPAHKPFVPATRVVAAMEKLLETDPAAALKSASAAIVDEKERRSEVKIGAQRILDALPIAKTLTHYLDLLTLASRPGVQTSKELGIDPWWYLQRTALKRLAREADFLKPGSPALVDLLKTAYKDRNASVRLAAADALTALGADPGPEVSYEPARTAPAPVMTPAPAPSAPQAPKKKGSWLPMIILFSALAGWWAFSNNAPSTRPPANPPAISQTITAPDSVKAPAAADSVKADPKDAALEQIARDTKRTADAAERSAKAAEEMAKPKGTSMGSILMMLAMAILPIFLLVWLMKKMMGGGGGAAGGINTKPKMDLEKPTARFDDVAGIDESLVEVQEIIDFLREPARFKKLGARMPKGILMEGPPGTGKTLLARALAGETSATFISISGSDFVELYVGMGARRVRELFETARQNAPAIIFIDEIDAVGKKRGDGGPGSGSNDEREQTINQILKEMDGFDNSSGVLVVAATNRADTLDAALTRPGRFDRKIHVGLPEAMGREAILALHARKARLAAEVDLRLIARRTAGLSGAFLENVINEAALLAARRGADSINGADIDEAVDRATIGGKRSLRLSEPLKRRIAAHEAGHVLANLLNENAEVRVPVNKVTIMPHGSGALGFAESGSEEGDKYLYTRAELEARLDTALGGLVAEKIFYGEWSTGPGSDLESATRVARAMVQQLGMSEEMGLAQTAPNQYGQSAFGGEADAKALVEVNKLLKASMERTEARLRAGAEKHKAMIEALMVKETLSADEIEAIAHPKPKR